MAQKLDDNEWLAEVGTQKAKFRSSFTWVSYRTAREDITPQVIKRFDLKPGDEITITAPNGNIYFTNRPAPPAPAVNAKKTKAKA